MSLLSGLFGSPKQPSLPPLQQNPTRSDAQVQAEALDARRRASAAGGRASTILAGSSSSGTGSIARKTLLGE